MQAELFRELSKSNSTCSSTFTSRTHTSSVEQQKKVRRGNYVTIMCQNYCHCHCPGLQDGRQDLSHPVHADNCILDEKAGDCLKISPAYTWRDYRYLFPSIQCKKLLFIFLMPFNSAILYLNGDIEGGEFFFAHSPKDISPQVSPAIIIIILLYQCT